MRRILLWIPVVAWSAAIWVVSGIGQLPSIPGGPGDKVLHVAAYFVHGLCASLALGRAGRPRTFLAAFLLTAGWGLLDEFHQSFVPGRDASSLDFAADLAGAAAAVALAAWVAGRRARRPQQVPA